MKIIKAFSVKSLVLILIITIVFCLIGGFLAINTFSSSRKFTVVIDAGHGGIDGGASGIVTGVRESDINLLIAKNLKSLFENSGFNVVMTRDSDEGLYGTTDPGFKKRDLKKREEIINGSLADLCVSIHLNVYSSSSRRGAQTFFNKDYPESKKLADIIQARINGMSMSPRLCNALSGDYYLLNTCKIPTVIVECGFLSSPDDEKLLISESYRLQISEAIFRGSIDYLSA